MKSLVQSVIVTMCIMMISDTAGANIFRKIGEAAENVVGSAKEQWEERREEKAEINECKKEAKENKKDCEKDAENAEEKKECEQDYKDAIAECEGRDPDDEEDEDTPAGCKKEAESDKQECLSEAEDAEERAECEQDYKDAIAECEGRDPDDEEAEAYGTPKGTPKSKSSEDEETPSTSDNGASPDQPNKPQTKKVISEEGMKQLEDNAKAMKDKEQSTANKLIGAAGIGLTGVGLRNTMEGMAEMQSDENATQSMKAYLQTFRCNWGGGTSYKGGEENIELPGAGALLELVTEYKTLAAELKEMKLALGMKPGIESEEILDSATMGLHDDERHGIESGAFTSVSRALLDENGEDAAAWAKQGSDAKKKRNTGIALAAAGAVGSAVASSLVNKNAPKERSEEILKEHSTEITVDKKEQPTASGSGTPSAPKIKPRKEPQGKPEKKSCADFDGTEPDGNYPDCKCASEDEIFLVDRCIPKTDAETKYNADGTCKLTGVVMADDCKCGTNARQSGTECVCDEAAGYHPSPNRTACIK